MKKVEIWFGKSLHKHFLKKQNKIFAKKSVNITPTKKDAENAF